MSFQIRSWKVSYYHNLRRTWVIGQLTCSPGGVSFETDEKTLDGNRKTDDSAASSPGFGCLQIKYADIKRVQRGTSMLIFAAVTVETSEGTVHWFSSLPDRHSVFNILNHFVQHALLDSHSKRKAVPDPVNLTQLGRRILQSAEDSERTLSAAATELEVQGRQLDRSSVGMREMHSDLDVADRLLSGLTSYLGHWSLPEQYTQVEPLLIEKGDVPTDQDLEVLSTELAPDSWHPQQLSTLRVSDDRLLLLSPRQRPLHTFRWVELSRVFIVSPWEVVLTRHVAGGKDVSVSLVGATLLPLLRVLAARVPHLIDYQDLPPEVAGGPREGQKPDSESKRGCHTFRQQDGPAHQPVTSPNTFHADQPTSNPALQGRQQAEVLSEAELRTLHSKLGGLKMMATAVGEELTSQNKTLDDMIVSADSADARVCDTTRRVKRLL